MNNTPQLADSALTVLLRSRDELLSEIARAGESGGTGRSQNFAPIFDSVCNAIEHVRKLRQAASVPQTAVVQETPRVGRPPAATK